MKRDEDAFLQSLVNAIELELSDAIMVEAGTTSIMSSEDAFCEIVDKLNAEKESMKECKLWLQ